MIYGICKLCEGLKYVQEHHWCPRGRHSADMKERNRIILLCTPCHINTHSLDNQKFWEKYHKDRKEFIKVKVFKVAICERAGAK